MSAATAAEAGYFDCRDAFSKTVETLAESDPRIVTVVSDSVGSSELVNFRKRFPERMVNVGIAEQTVVAVGAGLANGGKVPFVSAAACFLTGRALEQIKADIAYSNVNVKLIGQSSGVAYGELRPTHHSIAALGISNQRETIVLWDAKTGAPVGPAVIWQCRRSAGRCAALRAAGHAGEIEERTGLALDPLFPAAKIAWLLDEIPGARAQAEAGGLRAGTVDAWLLWKLTGGSCMRPITPTPRGRSCSIPGRCAGTSGWASCSTCR